MGAPVPETNAVEDVTVETLLSSLRTIDPGERRKHASVYNYWLSIKTDREFPPIRDLDPLEISDAGPFSVLLEMVGGGEDAGVRHLGHAIRGGVDAKTVSDAPTQSLLACIGKRLPVVAATRDAFAFEDQFETDDGKVRCWVTLLPFSATGTWIDYVYGFVSLAGGAAAEDSDTGLEIEPTGDLAEVLKLADELAEADAEPVSEAVEAAPEIVEPEPEVVEPEMVELEPEPEEIAEPAAEIDDEELAEPAMELSEEQADAMDEEDYATAKPKFSARFFETLANVGGFHGRPVKVELDPSTVSLETWDAEDPAEAEEPVQPEAISEEEPVHDEEAAQIEEPDPVEELEPVEELSAVDEPVAVEEPTTVEEAAPVEEPPPNIPTPSAAEGTLQSKLTDVRAKADEARQAKLRANAALYEGLSAAYDFALDAETAPEEYLKLVEAEGIKIQLRSPMKPVAKLAFDGMCDEATIKQLEAILAWAFEEELPRGTLAGRIEEAGGIGPILSGEKRAA